MSRGFIGVLVVVLFAAVVAGCGGGDDDSSLSKSEFTKQADAICAESEKEKNDSLQAAFNNPEKFGVSGKGEDAQLEFVSKVALPPIAKMTEELADLGGPSGEEEKAEAMVEAFEAEIQKIEDDPQSVVAGSAGEFEEANKLAKGMGLKACSLI